LDSGDRSEANGGEEHGVLESVVAAAAHGLASDRGAGPAGDWCKPGVAGELGCIRESAAVADLSEDSSSRPGLDSGQGLEQLAERVGQEHLLDFAGEGVAAVLEPVEFGGDFCDDAAECGLSG
jgi:hypothetical protein